MNKTKVDGMTIKEHLEIFKEYRSKIDKKEAENARILKENKDLRISNKEINKELTRLHKQVFKLKQMIAEVLKAMLFRPLKEEDKDEPTITE